MPGKLGVGVVGLGAIGVVHARAIKELEQEAGWIKLTAVVDQIKARADEIGRQFGAKSYYTLDELVKDPDVDVVTIATPSYLHAPQAMYAMEYHKHVIVEKPMAVTLAGAREMIMKAERNHVKLGVIFQERYAPDIIKAKSIISSGGLGKVFLVEAKMMWWRDERNYYNRDELARSWRGMWETEGGGALTNQGIHTVDLMYWLGGEVSDVMGFYINASHPTITVEDTAVAALKYRNGALGSLAASVSTQPSDFQFRVIRIYGTEGQLEINDRTITLLATNQSGVQRISPEAKRDTLTQTENLHKTLLRDFLNALREDRDFPINGYEGMKSLEVIKAIYLSSNTGQAIKLPLNQVYVV
ncbi:Gfo/Idh/MocA family protein [Caldivirga sp. UBA161]|uniref:Gfo/Idh/MocA family protein n=1 Tax=Caldivirga sp. UBA161 TaxID=1915569 RepID=UPI0025BDBCB2|nr:Gfo/Idh/MocA family oxidoreductase [Caldivirga sp. UBA161]